MLLRVTSPQNLARQRACSFTHKPDSSVGSRSHIVHSTPSSVVVTTTRVDLDHNDGSNDENFLARPRGYFADQFEASLRKNISATNGAEPWASRTGPTLMHTTQGRAQKSGNKQMDESMHSFRVQEQVERSLGRGII